MTNARPVDPLPSINRTMLRWFAWYSRRYVRRHFHAVRIAKPGLPTTDPAQPLMVYLNHPSWWDPMTCLLLATGPLGDRTHYAPISAAALGKYRFFERLGFFGVERDAARGARRFIKVASQVMRHPGHVLWITAQGQFTDVRERPVRLMPGTAHLASGLTRGLILPIAVEYMHWNERLPEALIQCGEPIDIASAAHLGKDGWQRLLEDQLEQAMTELATRSKRRDPAEFQTLLSGGGGVGPIYDLWRKAKAAIRGKRFSTEHETPGDDG